MLTKFRPKYEILQFWQTKLFDIKKNGWVTWSSAYQKQEKKGPQINEKLTKMGLNQTFP